MRRHLCNLLVFIALVFQGVVAVGGDVFVDAGQEQHCAGHDAPQKDCPCCPEGSAAGMNCTVQCSVSQAPVVVPMPVRVASYSMETAFSQRISAGPDYVPLVPPPIA